MAGEAKAAYDFPFTDKLPALHTYDNSIENLSTTKMVEECLRVRDMVTLETDAEIILSSYKNIRTIRIMNSTGTDISTALATAHNPIY